MILVLAYILLPFTFLINADSANNYVIISFNIMKSLVSCIFLNQLSESFKTCDILYGPVMNNCENLPFHTNARVIGSNSINANTDHDLNLLSMNEGICFIAKASIGRCIVQVEGIFRTGQYIR